MVKIEITQDLLKQLFDYRGGFLYWKTKTSPSSHNNIGKRAGGLDKKANRYRIKINGKLYFSARLIFFYHTGEWPETVDHSNHNTTDDRIEKLRAASKTENGRNRTSAKNSSSKYLGVHWNKKNQKWYASIRINTKLIHLGCFEVETEAALAYNKAAIKYFGEFANLNII